MTGLDHGMIADDPFTHEDFRDRLGKLLRLLSSDQEAEAEAARRKLLQHLAHHGVTLNDLTAHLSDMHEHGPTAAATDALRHAAVRAQQAEAAHRAAEEMNHRLLRSLQRYRRQSRTAWVTAGVLGITLVCAAGVMIGHMWVGRIGTVGTVQQISPRVSDMVGNLSNGAMPATAGDTGAHHPGEWIGTMLQPAELLDDPDSAAQRRAMLEAGARVLVLQSGPVWLRVRTERGDGYVLKGLVRADR